MKATTIKLEGKILSELNNAKLPEQSLTAFVKEILMRDLMQRKMQVAAFQYTEFLKSNQHETDWLEEWEKTDLVNSPLKKKRK